MTSDELIQEIEDAISFSCSLPYNLNRQETERIIKRSRAWFYDNYQYAVEERIMVLANQLFNHPEFRKTRQIKLPDSIVTIFDVREVGGAGISGNPDKDFSDSKLLGSELMLSPFIGDNLVYRTVMYSYFDLAKAYLLPTYAFKWNKNTKFLTILGRDPGRSGKGTGSQQSQLAQGFGSGGSDVAVRCFVAINDEYLYDDELFVRYVLAEAKINIGRLLGTFEYNLPGGVRINYNNIQTLGTTEKAEIIQSIKDENTPSWFLQWN